MKSIHMLCLALIGNSRSMLPFFLNMRPFVSDRGDFACMASMFLFFVLFFIGIMDYSPLCAL